MKQRYTLLAIQIYSKYVLMTWRLRGLFYGLFFKKTGKCFEVDRGEMIMSPQNVAVGDNVHIGKNVTIAGQKGITIGSSVIINYNVSLISVNHGYQNADKSIREQGYYGAPISIGDDVWICAGAIILHGVTIGKGAVVGANAVVTKNVPSYSVVGGIPARVINRRVSIKTTKKLR